MNLLEGTSPINLFFLFCFSIEHAITFSSIIIKVFLILKDKEICFTYDWK